MQMTLDEFMRRRHSGSCSQSNNGYFFNCTTGECFKTTNWLGFRVSREKWKPIEIVESWEEY